MNAADARALTVGVEEEFLLAEPSGHLSDRAAEVVAAAREDGGALQRELTVSQLESATEVCTSGAELLDQLSTLRARLARAAAARGLLVLASATAPLAEPDPPGVTPLPRYVHIAEGFGAVMHGMPTAGCHVHVGIPDRPTGVRLSNWLRPWLPLLLALTTNSPFHTGRDTGYCSWRYLQWSQWPSAGPPPYFASVAEHDAVVAGLLDSGAALDPGMLYWDVRVSAKQPTLEVRVADVAPLAADAVLLALLVRALIAVAGRSPAGMGECVSPTLLRAYLWRAARDGTEGALPSPLTGRVTPVRDLTADLLGYVDPVLTPDDRALVLAGVDRLDTLGTGAQRQRAAYRRRGRFRDVAEAVAVTAG